MEHLGVAQLVDAAGAGKRIDRPPLPGDAAEDGVTAERAGALGDGQGADDVAAAADPDREGAAAGEQLLDAGGRRLVAKGHVRWC